MTLEEGTDQMKLSLHGDPSIVCQMIRHGMQARQDIAAAFIASVVDYCHDEGFDCGELEGMVKVLK